MCGSRLFLQFFPLSRNSSFASNYYFAEGVTANTNNMASRTPSRAGSRAPSLSRYDYSISSSAAAVESPFARSTNFPSSSRPPSRNDENSPKIESFFQTLHCIAYECECSKRFLLETIFGGLSELELPSEAPTFPRRDPRVALERRSRVTPRRCAKSPRGSGRGRYRPQPRPRSTTLPSRGPRATRPWGNPRRRRESWPPTITKNTSSPSTSGSQCFRNADSQTLQTLRIQLTV